MTKSNFEANLKELEEILQQLENGDLPLEAALAKFEAGMHLIRICNQQLDAVDHKVEILLRDEAGALTTRPFQVANETEGTDT